MGKAVVVKGKAKIWDQTQNEDESLWQQLGMGSSKGRKAQGSAEKSYLDKGIEIVKGLFD
jgi:hypothetical protein